MTNPFTGGAFDLSSLANKPKSDQSSVNSSSDNKSVFDATDQTFEELVIKESFKKLILVDLWATWCGPCKQLSPVLEKLAGKSGGKWSLAKVDVDQNPAIASAFGAKSIPTVIALSNGQPVTAFQGVQPEHAIVAWIDKILEEHPPENTAEPENGEDTDRDSVVKLMSAMDELDNKNFDKAKSILSEIDTPEAKSLLVQVDFLQEASIIKPEILDDTSDPKAIMEGCDYLIASGKPVEGFDRIVAGIKKLSGKKESIDKLKEHMILRFKLFDPNDPIVQNARTKLANSLF